MSAVETKIRPSQDDQYGQVFCFPPVLASHGVALA